MVVAMQNVRAGVALAVLFLFPIVVAAVLVALSLLAILAGLTTIRPMSQLVAQLLVVPVLIAVIAAVRAVRSAKPRPAEGPELSRADNPELWATVDALASSAQTSPPDRIVLVPEANAAVMQVGGGRELLLGLPLVAGLTVGELRAVLAHELGHFAGGDVALMARTMAARGFLVGMRDHAGAFSRWLFAGYYRVYVVAAAASNRSVELRADRYAAEAAGPAVAAQAVRKLLGIKLAWDLVVEERVSMFAAAKVRAPLYEAVARTLHAEEDGIERATERFLAEQRPRWDDSHPRLVDRVEAISCLNVPPVPHDRRPALVLVGGGGRWLAEAEAKILRWQWPLASWDEVVTNWARATLPERMDRLVIGLHEEAAIDEETPLAALQALREDPAAFGGRAPDDSADASGAAAEFARIIVLGALTRSPGTRAVIDQEDVISLVEADGTVVDIGALAVAPIPHLLARLEALGARLDNPVDRSHLPSTQVPSVVLGAWTLTMAKGSKQFRDLLVCSDGLLFVAVIQSRWEMAVGNTRHNQKVRVEGLSEQLDTLRADPMNEWIPQAAIAHVNLRTLPPRMTISLVEGRSIVLKFNDKFEEIGLIAEHPLPVLLGDRLTRGRRSNEA